MGETGPAEKKSPAPPRGGKASGSKTQTRASVPVTLLMVTLVMVGLFGTLRMRKHALEHHRDVGNKNKVFSPEELIMFDGRARGPIYIGILGKVFDVTAGKRHYGPGGSYEFFAGRDASRAYVTGKFQDDLNDDVRDLDPSALSGLVDWRSFYEKHEKYGYVGKVVGRLYGADGAATPLLGMVEMRAAEFDAAQEERKKRETDGSLPAVCSYRWHKDTGGQVSCGDEGGHPRRVFDADKGREICRCMEQKEISATVRAYDGCALDATSCRTTPGSADEL